MKIYKTLGLEKLFEDRETELALANYICENRKLVIPGYFYDYTLYTSKSYLEFYKINDIKGNYHGIDLHFCDNNIVELKFVEEMDNESYCKMCCERSKTEFQVKMVNYDIFPSLEKGEKINGQIVAFGEASSLAKKDFTNKELKVKNSDDEYTEIDCVPSFDNYATKRHFEFLGVSCDFWELQVKTVIGKITLLLDASKCDVNFDEVNGFSVKAYISFDVGIGSKTPEKVFYPGITYFELLGCEEDSLYRNGFVPNFNNAQKILCKSIIQKNYNRLLRACEQNIEFAINDAKSENKSREDIVGILEKIVPQADKVKRVHILKAINDVHLGYEALAIYKENRLVGVLSICVSQKGLIDKVVLFDVDACIVGNDYELNRLSVLSYGMTQGKANVLSEYLAKNCKYRSDFSDRTIVGCDAIIERLNYVNSNLDDNNLYFCDITKTKNELLKTTDKPDIYSSKWCGKLYQETKECMTSVIFLKIDNYNKISEIYLSRDNTYLKHTFTKNEEVYAQGYNIKEVLSDIYQGENTLDTMRKSDVPTVDDYNTYVWKYSDQRTMQWLADNGYKIDNAELFENCIGYSCTRKGKQYAIYVYAFGKKQTVMMDGDTCAALRKYDFSANKEVLILYIKVDVKVNDDGEKEYIAGGYADGIDEPEPWCLKNVNDRNILLHYPRAKIVEVLPKIIAAYNELNYDVLKSIFSKNNMCINDYSCNEILFNDAVYSRLLILRKTKGEMKLAYIRKNDVVFSCVGYIEDYGYLGFSMNEKNKVVSLEVYDLGSFYRELIIDQIFVDPKKELYYPNITKLDFYEPSEFPRFSMRLEFDNGEIRRYDLPGVFDDSSVFEYDHKVITDKIFRNARISDHLESNDGFGLKSYPMRGQGIEFISGIKISSAELYADSYPVERFSYKNLDNVLVLQDDYDDNGYGVGHIYNLDPQNPLYLLDNTTKIATTIPQEYQNTSIGIIPFYGGCYEGLIMVSKIETPALKYYHNFGACAGMWGWIDLNFKMVIEPQYIFATNFYNGKALVCKGDWNITKTEYGERYWCEKEQWGIIDKTGNEIVPCQFDELYEISNSNTLFFAHKGGWQNGNFCIYDSNVKDVVLELDFDFDMGYMFNECLMIDEQKLVLVDHLPGEGEDLIYIYDFEKQEYIMYKEKFTERTLNGEKTVIVNKDGQDIIVF